jgi:hypothetical protein
MLLPNLIRNSRGSVKTLSSFFIHSRQRLKPPGSSDMPLPRPAALFANDERGQTAADFLATTATGPLCASCKRFTTYDTSLKLRCLSTHFDHGSGIDMLKRASGESGCRLCYVIIACFLHKCTLNLNVNSLFVEECFGDRKISSQGQRREPGRIFIYFDPPIENRFLAERISVIREC